jgi:hypothetical protein
MSALPTLCTSDATSTAHSWTPTLWSIRLLVRPWRVCSGHGSSQCPSRWTLVPSSLPMSPPISRTLSTRSVQSLPRHSHHDLCMRFRRDRRQTLLGEILLHHHKTCRGTQHPMILDAQQLYRPHLSMAYLPRTRQPCGEILRRPHNTPWRPSATSTSLLELLLPTSHQVSQYCSQEAFNISWRTSRTSPLHLQHTRCHLLLHLLPQQ